MKRTCVKSKKAEQGFSTKLGKDEPNVSSLPDSVFQVGIRALKFSVAQIEKAAKSTAAMLVCRCPGSRKIVRLRFDNVYARIAFPLVGLLAVIWFLIRVIPKPSRAAYPCQQAAVGIGTTFLVYLVGTIGSMAIYDKIRKIVSKPLALGYLSVLVLIISIGFSIAQNIKPDFIPNLNPPEGTNNPMGEGRGIFPGRVVWSQDFNATNWDEKTGKWWDDTNINQAETDKMISEAIQKLTGKNSDKKAWQSLFEYNNFQAGRGNRGYRKGEKIVVKVNMNAIGKLDAEWLDKGYPSPQMVYSLVKQLVNVAGVSGEDIIITDPSRFINGPLVGKLHGNMGNEFSKILLEEKEARNLSGFRKAEPDTTAEIWFVMADGSKYRMCLPKSFSEATYIINYSLVRPHRVFGITSAAKNHYGSVWDFKQKAFNPNFLHAFALWDYPTPNTMKDPHSSPVLIGHQVINSKTMLYLADGLYTSINQGGKVQRMSTFNNDWFSSLLMSQDPVALESVVYDFIVSEPNLYTVNPSFNGNQENQFHECALANNPPSGTKYDPENDGTLLNSLGVHEHWNNARERLYSRNMGKDYGIELVSILK